MDREKAAAILKGKDVDLGNCVTMLMDPRGTGEVLESRPATLEEIEAEQFLQDRNA